jgi:hypothetical protein
MSLHIARPSKVNWQIFLGSATVTVLTFCQRKATTPSNGSNGVNVCKCESSSWLHANTLCNPWIQNQLVSRDLQNNLYGGTQSSAPLILASSPQYANTDSQVHKRRWWAFFWRSNKSRNNSRNKTSWIQKIGQTIFVITRGLEIVVRISPLLILTPTALIVSSVDSLFRRVWHPKKHIISTSGGTEEDNNLFIQQLQEFDDAVRNVHHGQTWASNLAWRYTLYTLQSLGPAFSKLGQWLVDIYAMCCLDLNAASSHFKSFIGQQLDAISFPYKCATDYLSCMTWQTPIHWNTLILHWKKLLGITNPKD